MTFRVEVSHIFHCTLERAFKTALLADLSKIHRGYGPVPRVTHCTEDDDWGKLGSIKRVHLAPSLFMTKGHVFSEKLLAREEGRLWRFEMAQLPPFSLGFSHFIGEWETQKLSDNHIQVSYSYNLISNTLSLYPLQWLFANYLWKQYMKRVMANVERLIDEQEPYLYN